MNDKTQVKKMFLFSIMFVVIAKLCDLIFKTKAFKFCLVCTLILRIFF